MKASYAWAAKLRSARRKPSKFPQASCITRLHYHDCQSLLPQGRGLTLSPCPLFLLSAAVVFHSLVVFVTLNRPHHSGDFAGIVAGLGWCLAEAIAWDVTSVSCVVKAPVLLT